MTAKVAPTEDDISRLNNHVSAVLSVCTQMDIKPFMVIVIGDSVVSNQTSTINAYKERPGVGNVMDSIPNAIQVMGTLEFAEIPSVVSGTQPVFRLVGGLECFSNSAGQCFQNEQPFGTCVTNNQICYSTSVQPGVCRGYVCCV